MNEFRPDEKQKQERIDVRVSEDSTLGAPAESFTPGSIIGGSFRVLSFIGAGGMSEIYLCEDLAINRTVAIKVLSEGAISSGSGQLLKRFQSEGKIIARLNHPNIVTLYGMQSTADGVPFLVMEYVSGSPLSAIISGGNGISPQRAIKLGSQICDGLQAAHDAGIIHRDLKPSNIIVIDVGKITETVKILDFGIAKIQNEAAAKATRTGEVFGTPQYMSPEQAMAQPCDRRSDQYSLGCILYEALCGSPPFEAENMLGLLMSHVNHKPVPLSSRCKSLPPHVEATIAKMMSKNPADRFESVSEAKRALLGEISVTTVPYKMIAVWAAFVIGISGIIFGAWTYFIHSYDKPSVSQSYEKPDENAQQLKAAEVSKLTQHEQSRGDAEAIIWFHNHPNCESFSPEQDLGKGYKAAISDDFIEALGSTRKLKKLMLNQCYSVTNKLLPALVIEPLIDLNLHGTGLTDDPSIKALSKLKSLLRLDLSSTAVGDRACEAVSDLPALWYLDLSETEIKNPKTALAAVGRISSLRALLIHGNANKIKNSILGLTKSNLTLLIVGSDELSDADFAALSKIHSLVHLGLVGSQITERQLALVWQPELQSIDLHKCRNVTISGAREFAKSHHGVELDLDRELVAIYDPTIKAHAGGKNLIRNPSFEVEIPSHWSDLKAGLDTLAPWKIVSGTVGLTGNEWQAAEGHASLELNGNSPGVIEQTFSTKPGARYLVGFYEAAQPFAPETGVQAFKISAAGQSEKTQVEVSDKQKRRDMGWHKHEWQFTANGPTTTLRFESLTPAEFGACIDDVSVTRIE